MEVSFVCFHILCSKSVHWEDLFDLLSSVFSEKKKLQGDFYQPVSRMLTEDDDYCFNILVAGDRERYNNIVLFVPEDEKHFFSVHWNSLYCSNSL